MNKFLLLLCWVLASPLWALTPEQTGADKPLTDYIADYVDVPKGAVAWKLFGTTQEIPAVAKGSDGDDIEYSKPLFQPDVKALDGQTIMIKGYMFPLDQTDDQTLFLFGPFPMTCPFHYHVGPSLVIEVHAKQHPVTFTYDPVVLTGKLELVANDPDFGTFYRLLDARLQG